MLFVSKFFPAPTESNWNLTQIDELYGILSNARCVAKNLYSRQIFLLLMLFNNAKKKHRKNAYLYDCSN